MPEKTLKDKSRISKSVTENIGLTDKHRNRDIKENQTTKYGS